MAKRIVRGEITVVKGRSGKVRLQGRVREFDFKVGNHLLVTRKGFGNFGNPTRLVEPGSEVVLQVDDERVVGWAYLSAASHLLSGCSRGD
jgi:hypothetical protein